jgi:serine phosphatase RsbU (regulator of sigma subunit)
MRLYREQRQLATELQRAMLTDPVSPDHLQITARYVPATGAAQVGGDWYDAFLQPDGHTSLVIGDVVGHDTSAAAAMGQLRSLLRGIAVTTGHGPAQILHSVDQALLTLRTGALATAVVARVERSPAQSGGDMHRVRWSNAGHPAPMLVQGDGRVVQLEADSANLILGLLPETERTESGVTLAVGSTLFLYTDGLVERRDRPVDVGMEQLGQVLSACADLELEALCDTVLAEMLAPHPSDDVALIAVRPRPSDRPRPPEAGEPVPADGR